MTGERKESIAVGTCPHPRHQHDPRKCSWCDLPFDANERMLLDLEAEVERLRARLAHSVCATCGKSDALFCSSAYHLGDSDA